MRAKSIVAMAGAVLLWGIATSIQISAQEPRKEYISTADQREVLRDDLVSIPGKEVHVIQVGLPVGWVGGRHYHTGDVFVYIIEGQFTVDVDGEGRKTFGPGEVYHEAVNKVMHARNSSTTAMTRLIVFQIGDKGEPLMIKAD